MAFFSKSEIINRENALKGREMPLQVAPTHFVNGNNIFAPFPDGNNIFAPFPDGFEIIYFGMGCFWGAERKFWQLENVYVTAVGYGAGYTQNPNYEEVCTGKTGHNELVMVVYNPIEISLDILLKTFFESHNPTQIMRQGNDIGSQYRSGIYPTTLEQAKTATKILNKYQISLKNAGFGKIATEIKENIIFYYAETYHQQYLAKNIDGYCGLGGIGVSCPIG